MCLFAASLLFSFFSFQPQSKLQECELLWWLTQEGKATLGSAVPSQYFLMCLSLLSTCMHWVPATDGGWHTSWALPVVHLLLFPHKGPVLGRFWTNLSFCFLSYFPASLCSQEGRSEISTETKSKKLTVRFMTITRNSDLFDLPSCTESHLKKKRKKK